MLYDGLSEKNSSKLCKFILDDDLIGLQDFYQKHESMIKKTVFVDSYFAFNFWKIISENIKRSHSNLQVILRKQYPKSDEVFAYLKSNYENNKYNTDSLLLIKQIVFTCPCISEYARNIFKFIINPVLFRHHIYSPILSFVLFIDLMYFLCGNYIDPCVLRESKLLLINYKNFDDINVLISNSCWITDIEKKILLDETLIHRDLMSH